ncbi:NADH-quinone oxidoreductase subunit A [Candidatus Poribacteria bacterium]|nr:NADH-quinone oxidoreductase subunit A [Candidatus Poribacteria bacterium]
MRYEFANVFVFILVGCAFILVNNVLSKLARPQVFSSEKYVPYECGEDPVDDARLKFNIRFYTTALIFLLFDVEIAFLFPWAVVFKQIGVIAFVEMFIFVGVLLIGLAYVWVKGDLDWVRTYRDVREPEAAPDLDTGSETRQGLAEAAD